MSATITITGDLFTGHGMDVIDEALEEAKDVVAQQGLADVHQLLDRYIQNPTPYYETQILVQRVSADRVVHDRGIVYGPWLEGVSKRNQNTRFGGYHSFRQAGQELERETVALVEPILEHYLGRL